MTTLPLAGIRVLSLAEQYPGPFATMLLADLGADVILVERPAGGDPSRRFPGLFMSLNRNKRSVTLDLKSAQGHADFMRLVDSADAVVEGFRPGMMARLGIGAEALRARKPSLVFASISSMGQTGPNVNIAGHDLSLQAAAGMVDIPLGKEAESALPVLPLADIASGMYAAFGIAAALFARSRSGLGATIDVSMLDSLVSWMTASLVPPMNGVPIRVQPPEDPGYGVFATSDQRQITLSIAGEDPMWSALCGLLGLDQFASLREDERNQRRGEIVPHLRQAVARWPCDLLCKKLEQEKIAFGPVLALAEVLAHPHMVARGMRVDVDGPAGVQKFVRQALIIDGQVGSLVRQAPMLGEHNDQVLGSLPPSH